VKVTINNHIMQMRFSYFSKKLKETEDIVARFQENDGKIRVLLDLGTNKSIIKEGLVKYFGEGGPSIADKNNFDKVILSYSKSNVMDYSGSLYRKLNIIYEECKFIKQSYIEVMSYVREQKSLFMATPNGWPCEGSISSVYGFRMHPLMKSTDFHKGIDIANVSGTPIKATADGVVIFSGVQSSFGNVIAVDHGYGYTTLFAHLSKRIAETGTYVSRGQTIAEMGSSGISTGPHLHYEVLFRGKSVNPKLYLTDYFFLQSEGRRYDKKKYKKFA
jgi:murein DD-endopeptidase MepM/ murein hydrolase activator NlpD